MASDTDRLTFAWWNTGLSPAGKKSSHNRTVSEDDFREAVDVVSLLFRSFQVDCLALGEVTKDDLYKLHNSLKLKDYSVYDGTLRKGRAAFDTGAIYSTSRFLLYNDLAIIEESGNRSLKLANRLDLMIKNDTSKLHLFVSHRPSHIQPDSEELRITLACRLRKKLDQLIKKYKNDYKNEAHIIIMGDFNEEPFHHCIEKELLATRDRSLARKNPSYIYNPFWRHLGESMPYTFSISGTSFAGTCFLKGSHTTRWKTVDQIIVSSTSLGSSDWHLNEELTGYLPVTPMARKSSSSPGIFDHFPVMAVFEKAR